MAGNMHELAPHHIPGWVPGADGGDPLFTVVVVFVLILVMGLGVLYLKLHSLPEHMAHDTSSAQLQIVSMLALLALFTHNNMFWVAALLLAAIKLPDIVTPLNEIARALGDKSTNAGPDDTKSKDAAPTVSKPTDPNPAAESGV